MMSAPTTDRQFQDWCRVQDRESARQGVIVWNPTTGEYNVLWDDNGWEEYSPAEAKRELEEAL